MTTNTTGPACREIRQLLGVYVVGAIDPAERAYVDAHLADCGACREELGGLAGLPALLGRVPVAEVEMMSEADAGGPGVPDMLEPPAELRNSLLHRVSARKRSRRRRSVLALAAAVAIAAGGTAAVYETHQPSSPDVVRASNAELTSEVQYSATPWGGTAMDVAVKGLPPRIVCQFWVRTTAGQWSDIGSWTTPPGYQERWYSISSPVGVSQVNGFRITSGGRTLLLIPAS